MRKNPSFAKKFLLCAVSGLRPQETRRAFFDGVRFFLTDLNGSANIDGLIVVGYAVPPSL